jgi:hypothetical protein
VAVAPFHDALVEVDHALADLGGFAVVDVSGEEGLLDRGFEELGDVGIQGDEAG